MFSTRTQNYGALNAPEVAKRDIAEEQTLDDAIQRNYLSAGPASLRSAFSLATSASFNNCDVKVWICSADKRSGKRCILSMRGTSPRQPRSQKKQ